MNILRIFNEKEVDEILVLDISATLENREPNWSLLHDIASECFMPLGYGGGLNNLKQVKRLLEMGYEKICVNSIVHTNPDFISKAADTIGTQSIMVCLDAKKKLLGGYCLLSHCGGKKTNVEPAFFAKEMEARGAGEIVINSVDRDGTMSGYDLDLTQTVADAVNIPVIACGGAATTSDFSEAVNKCNASAVAAGSMFVFQGPHRAVLISYPDQGELDHTLI